MTAFLGGLIILFPLVLIVIGVWLITASLGWTVLVAGLLASALIGATFVYALRN